MESMHQIIAVIWLIISLLQRELDGWYNNILASRKLNLNPSSIALIKTNIKFICLEKSINEF